MPDFQDAVPKLTKPSLQFTKLEIVVSPLAPNQTDADAHIQLGAVLVQYDWESTDNGATWTHRTGPVVKRVNVSPERLAAVPPEQRAAIYGALKGLLESQRAADEAAPPAEVPPVFNGQ